MGATEEEPAGDKSEKSGLIPEDHSKPLEHDPNFKGPLKDRSCTDCICCIVFIIFLVGMGAVSIWAFMNGDPTKLIYPTDSDGNLCGSGENEGKPDLFFFDLVDCARMGAAVIATGCPTPQVCVSACPNKTWTYMQDLLPTPTINPDNLVCKNSVDLAVTTKTLQELISDEDCAAYYMESSSLVGRCVPSFIAELGESLSGEGGVTIVDALGNAVNGTALADSEFYAYLVTLQGFTESLMEDFTKAYLQVLVFLGIGCLISFVLILLMRCFAGCMVWLSILLFVASFTFATTYCFIKYDEMKNFENATVIASVTDIEFTTNLEYWSNLEYTWLVMGIISAIFLGVMVCILIFLGKRICIAIELVKEASKAVGCMWFTLLWPIWPFIFEVILFGYWGATAVFLASSGYPRYGSANVTTDASGQNAIILPNGTEVLVDAYEAAMSSFTDVCDTTSNDTAGSICSFIANGGDEYTIYLQLYMLFMLFWVMNFIIAVGDLVQAGAFASYYWAFDKSKDVPTFPLAGALMRTFRYHLGSAAFGSFIIALIQIIRVILEYIDTKVKSYMGGDTSSIAYKIAKFVLCCMKCFFWCLEKCMKFLARRAYIMIAVRGKNFCVSAKNVFFLMLRNILRVAAVTGVTGFLMFLCKMLVTGANTGMAFYFFSGDLTDHITLLNVTGVTDVAVNVTPELNYYLIPVIMLIPGTYIIAKAFFSVYEMAIDTMFICFLEDLEMNDGSAEKPYFMSSGLADILDVANVSGKKGKKKKGCCSCC